MNCPGIGHFEAQVFDEGARAYLSNSEVSVLITVEETFDNDHRVVNQKGSNKGRFTFSAGDSGQHRLCFTPQGPGSGGWLSGGQTLGAIKFSLDMAIGETSKIESDDKQKIDDIVTRVRDLNSRLQDIRREQVFQRVRTHILLSS
jgi:p24 family protein alpha